MISRNDKSLEKSCFDIFYTTSATMDNLYSLEMYASERKRIESLRREVDEYICNHLSEEDFIKNLTSSYIIALYVVHYLEGIIDNDTFLLLMEYLIDEKMPKYHSFSPILCLLQVEKKLPEELLRKLSSKIENENLREEFNEKNKMPYDEKYFFLRRIELPEDLKGRYLTMYDSIDMECLKEFLKTFMCDLNNELHEQKIMDLKEIGSEQPLAWDYNFYLVIKKYIKNRKIKTKKI